MQALSVFSSRIAPRVLGAIDLTIEQAVLDTCIDFCEQTLAVQATLESFATIAGTPEYELPQPTYEAVCRVMRVWCDDQELIPSTRDSMPAFGFVGSIPGITQVNTTPRFFQEATPGSLWLLGTPDKAYTINVRAAVKPLRTASVVEDVLFDDYVDAIVHGALSRLYAMIGQPFGNPGASGAHQLEYIRARNAALLEASRGRTRAEIRANPIRI